MGLNRITLIGRAAEPKVKEFESGKVANFSFATKETWKDRNGDWKEETTWHNIAAYGSLAGVVERYVRKGSLLYIEGKIRRRKYTDRDGVEREIVEVLASGIELLGDKPSQNNASSSSTSNDMDF